MIREQQLCASLSCSSQEPLIGTAATADIWCLLEYTERWNEYAVKDSTLPTPVLRWLTETQRRYPTFRPQFIKQHDYPLQTITCFIAISRQDRQTLYKFQFATYEELLQIDLAALLHDPRHYASYQVKAALFLVCTHGKHDRCCARFGLPLYQEAARQFGDQVWQISHIGGDRFAANLLCLPYGLYYGRVTRSDLTPLITTCHARQIYLAKYRGRSCFPPVEQAADYFLRLHTANTYLQAYTLSQKETISEACSQVVFREDTSGVLHRLTLQISSSTITDDSICQGPQTRKINTYRLHNYARQLPLPSEAETVPMTAILDR